VINTKSRGMEDLCKSSHKYIINKKTNKTNENKENKENKEVPIKVGSRYLSTILEDLWPKALDINSSADAFVRLSQLEFRTQFSPGNLITYLELINEHADIIKTASDWVTLQNYFKKSQRYTNENGVNSAFVFLNAYLFHYLPLWFAENDSADCEYPYMINQLAGVLFINRPVEINKIVPKTLFELIEKATLFKSLKKNTKKTWINNLKLSLIMLIII